MNITIFFALSNKPTIFFRCITTDDDEGAAKIMDSGYSPQTNNQTPSIHNHSAMVSGGRHKAIMSRPLLDSEAVAREAADCV